MLTSFVRDVLIGTGRDGTGRDGGIPKDVLYGELSTGTRPTGRPTLRFKDVCQRYLKAGSITLVG